MKQSVRFGATLLMVCTAVLISSCWQPAVEQQQPVPEPPTADDIELATLSDACIDGLGGSEGFFWNGATGATDLATLLSALAEQANFFAGLALDNWSLDTEETYTVIYAQIPVTITWTTTGTEWVWTMTFQDGQGASHEAVLTVERVADGWHVHFTLDDVLVVDGTVTPDTGEFAATFSGTDYTLVWGPATADPLSYDLRVEVHQLGAKGEDAAGVVVEFSAGGTSGSWEYTEGGAVQRSGSWPLG